jgi:glycosyltransferase involved in cell wall biosynthesis
MKVFEYMASGRPIVISDLPVLREVLRPDVDALMVPPEDPDALIAALIRLRDDPQLGASGSLRPRLPGPHRVHVGAAGTPHPRTVRARGGLTPPARTPVTSGP